MIETLGNQVIVKEAKAEEANGLILSHSGKENITDGQVVSVGDGYLLNDGSYKPMKVKVGDKVLFRKFSAQAFTFENQELFVIQDTDIVGIYA